MMNFKVLLQLYHKETQLLVMKYNSIYDNETIRKTVQEVRFPIS
jgi:hypothetical protein